MAVGGQGTRTSRLPDWEETSSSFVFGSTGRCIEGGPSNTLAMRTLCQRPTVRPPNHYPVHLSFAAPSRSRFTPLA